MRTFSSAGPGGRLHAGQEPVVPRALSLPHVAFAVADFVETRAELDRMGTSYWVAEGIVGPQSQQIFMHDPAGNMIELHQAGICRCQAVSRLNP
jgi:catechol 2,3-dioxygenase-like lactoylglutathione lyase family enzyme